MEHDGWRCIKCKTLLGAEKGSRLHLRYKQMQYVVGGEDYNITAVCRKCSTINEKFGSKKQLTA